MKRLYAVLIILFFMVGCKFVQVSPSLEAENYRVFGQDLGIYLKNTEPKFVAKSKNWVEGALKASDEELLNGNVLQVAFEYAMEKNPDNAALILLIKSMINTLGIKVDVSSIIPDERPAYVANVRALLQAYAKATEGITVIAQ